MKKTTLMVLAVTALILAGCGSTKDVPYLIDANQLSQDVLNAAARMNDPVLMPGDMLQINVSGPDPEVVKPFNKSEYVSSNHNTNQGNNQDNSIYYYLVDNSGNIEFPMLGTLHVGGMTLSAMQEHIAAQIYPRYLNVKPGVEARIQNFRVFTMGEVGHPGVVRAPNGRLNILEAIAQSGDLNIKGRRDNITIYRTTADGSRVVRTVNLNDPKLLVSPDFYLQQNDIIYVEPNASQARSSWSMPPGLSLGLSLLGTIMSVTTFVITLTK
ncbi:MAG: polysaccharide biosynthesis/export family protein [Muribaculaceae bacterium]|nr:polysaccharide biosynthesis/export family protein [Muribaculaceae bacterium]